MKPPSSIWLPFEGHWETALTAHEWTARFGGPLPPAFEAWLEPGPRAAIVPCIHPDGCGQPHRVRRLYDRTTWIAVPEEPDCESFLLDSSAVETRRVGLSTAAQTIAHTLRLDCVAIEHLQSTPALLRLGHAGRNVVPCFFSVACSLASVSQAVASLVLAQPSPVIIFVPLARNIPTAVQAAIGERGGRIFAFDDLIELDGRGHLSSRKPISDLMPALGTTRTASRPRLLVPPGTPWSAIRLKIINGKILVASHGSRTAQATADQLNQVPRDNPDEFRPGWRTLVAFAAKGVLTGEEDHLFPNESDFKNRRADVRNILRDFINITDDPIRDLRTVPEGEHLVANDNRAHRDLRRGFTLHASIQLITGVDQRVGHLDDVMPEDPDRPDSADSYPGRSRLKVEKLR